MQWLLTTLLPISGAQEVSLDPEVYRQQVLAAMAAGDPPRQRKRHEVEPRLTEIIAHYHDYPDEYIALSVLLQGSIDGLDSCFAGEEDHQQIRRPISQTLFAIYRFSTDSGMDLDEDIPALLIGNTTLLQREIITQRGSVMHLLSSSQPGRPDGAVGPVAWNTRH